MKKIFLAMSLPISLLATDVSNYKQPEPSQQEKLDRLDQAKKQKEEIRRKLNEIPKLQQKIIAFQRTIENAGENQRKLAQLYLKAQRICKKQKAKNELAGMSFSQIVSNYEKCQEMFQNYFVDSSQHNQLMSDIKSYKQVIQTHIIEYEELIGRKDTLETREAYVDEAILMLEEAIKGKENK